MTTQKQRDSAINRTFKRLEKIAARKDKDGHNPYLGIYYFNRYFYVTDSICMVKVSYDEELVIPSTFHDSYYKVNVIEQLDQVKPLINLSTDHKTDEMNYRYHNHTDRALDKFFTLDEPTTYISVDPKRLKELLDLFEINKIIPTITQDTRRIKLHGCNDFCRIEAVLAGIRVEKKVKCYGKRD